MRFADFHIDTLMHILIAKSKGEHIDLYKNELNIDIKRLKESNYAAQIFACFVNLGEAPITTDHYNDALGMIKIFHEEVDKHKGLIALATDYDSYLKNKDADLISGFLAVEEGGIIGEDIKKLDELFSLGVRLITLTWNHENSIGFPNFMWEHQNEGLKEFGLEVVSRMDELGIAVDVSHLSDGGFKDIVTHGNRPFIATHSNCRAIQNHPRNLSDDMIKDLANRGGIAGLNFCQDFLESDGRSSVEAMINHIRHFIKVGGDEIVGLGTDFDGIPQHNLEIAGAQDVPKLVTAMEKAGFTERQIEGFCYKNFEKFLERYERG